MTFFEGRVCWGADNSHCVVGDFAVCVIDVEVWIGPGVVVRENFRFVCRVAVVDGSEEDRVVFALVRSFGGGCVVVGCRTSLGGAYGCEEWYLSVGRRFWVVFLFV